MGWRFFVGGRREGSSECWAANARTHATSVPRCQGQFGRERICGRERRCPLAGMVAEIGTRRGAVQRQARGESHTRGTRAARCERHACWLCPNQRKVVRVLCACVVPALVRFSQTRFLRLRLADYPYPANDIFLLAEAERFWDFPRSLACAQVSGNPEGN